MEEMENTLAAALEEFRSHCDYIRTEAPQHDAYTVECRVLEGSRRVCRLLLQAYFQSFHGGDVGETIRCTSGEVLRRERLKSRDYVSVFGELDVPRWYYHGDSGTGIMPLDEQTNMPARSYSYCLQEVTQKRVNRQSFDESVEDVENMFGVRPEKHTVERLTSEIAEDVDAFLEQQPPPAAETEAEIIVAAIDGKGVPLLRSEAARLKIERQEEQAKHSPKKEAVVAAVYTIEPYCRTADDVVKELRKDEKPSKPRPKPQNKRLRATLSGKQNGIEWAAEEVTRRDPENTKTHACVMDGSPGLWKTALGSFTRTTFILDIFHVLQHLWKAAHAFYGEDAPEADAFVTHRLRMLLEGKVGYVVGGLRQMLTKHELKAKKRKAVECVIKYYERNREWMRYDEYLSRGLPIGSGVVEGACCHLVSDRMERSGMKWTVSGAEAVLKLRALALNGDWDVFWRFHQEREKERRFGSRQWVPWNTPSRRKAAG